MNMRASGASELYKIAFTYSKTAISFLFCWYFRYFVSETYLFSGLQLHLHTLYYNQSSMQFPFITFDMAL